MKAKENKQKENNTETLPENDTSLASGLSENDREKDNTVNEESDSPKADENTVGSPDADLSHGEKKRSKKKKSGKKDKNSPPSKKKSSRLSTILILVVLIAGLSILLYPSISEYWNSFHSSKAIADYASAVGDMNEEEYARLLSEAAEYNKLLAERENTFLLDDDQKEQYHKMLSVSGLGMMGYIEIPSINVSLPLYHGTEDSVLQIAVGHIDWSSLPIGGINTHSVLSGHRGLPSAKLFSDLDKLEIGDVFVIRILNEVFTYEVDQILIVNPDESDSMVIVEGEDLCTLVTCTPYGINSHRLLVRGHRTDNLEEAKIIRVTADAVQIEPMIIAPIIAIPILFVLLMVLLFKPKKKKAPEKITKEDFM